MIPITASNLAMVAAVVVVLLRSQPFLALIALAPLPMVNLLSQRFSRRIHPAVLAVQVEQAQLATVVEESRQRCARRQGLRCRRRCKRTGSRVEADDIRRVSLDSARIRSSFLPALDLLPNLGMIAVLGIGGHRVLNGDMTSGQMLEFMQYIALLIFPLRNLGMTVAFGQRAAAALLRVNEVLSTTPEIDDPDVTAALPFPLGRLWAASSSSRSHFGYEPASAGAARFRPDHPAGEIVALVGATGTGKSTIARLLDAVLRRLRGVGPAGRHRRPRSRAGRPAAGGRHRVRGHVPVQRHRRGQHRLRPARRRSAGRSSTPPVWPALTSSSSAARRIRHRHRRARATR